MAQSLTQECLRHTGRKQLEKEAREWKQATTILDRFLSPAREAS